MESGGNISAEFLLRVPHLGLGWVKGAKRFAWKKDPGALAGSATFFYNCQSKVLTSTPIFPISRCFFGHNEGCKRFAWTKVESLGARKKYDFFLEIYPKKVFISALKCLICIKVFLERNTGDC